MGMEWAWLMADVRRVASRELRVRVGSGTKAIWVKQEIPQGLGRLRVRSLGPPVPSHFLPP